jgi:Zn-dependent peptidase ImmA (M78 family)/plasmid maintenance system antidote protein VapI
MINSVEFSPSWASPPGETILEILSQRDVEVEEFSSIVGIDLKYCERLLAGYESITGEIAKNIELVTEVPAKFWLKREASYRKQLDSNKDERIEWLKKLPTQDMVKWNWIPKGLKRWDKFEACLNFFNVKDLYEWDIKFANRLSNVAFRTSSSFDTVPESVIVWLHQVEKIALDKNTNCWDSEKLLSLIPAMRSLTLNDEPRSFLPKLDALLCSCGVSLVVLPTPKGTRASGATFFAKNDKPILALSFRFGTNDHFWFSLFHEIGHLILHSKTSIFIEDKTNANSIEEIEADQFAQTSLIPAEYRAELLSLSHKELRKILKFSKKLGIAKGIVVGQLQHAQKVPHNYLNKLKVRYDISSIFHANH